MADRLGCGGMVMGDDPMQFKRVAESACEMARSLGCVNEGWSQAQ